MVSSGGYFPQGAVVGLPNMGASAPAALEMVSDGGVFASAALEMVSDRGASAPAAAVGKFSARFSLLLAGIYWGFAPYPPPSFLPLMEEKKAKEDQGARGTGQVDRVRVGVGKGMRNKGTSASVALSLFLVLGDQQQLVAFV